MKKLFASPVGRVTALVVVMAMCLLGLQAGNAAAATSKRPVATSKAGQMTSRVVGTAGHRDVTGSFTPLKVVKRDGKVFMRGLIQGVVHNKNGSRTTFAKLKTVRVKSVNGVPATNKKAAARAVSQRASCRVLHLDLAPIHLDLLGLNVDLQRVVLDITAESGPGNLLGNLLCAVTGLLDNNTLQGLLGRLTDLLNRILGALNLG